MTERTILALDLGTKTGWALANSYIDGIENVEDDRCLFTWAARNAHEGDLVHGTLDLSNDRFEGGGMRYLRLLRWLDKISDLVRIDEVYFEEVRRHIGTDASHVYGGFLGILTSWCERGCIPYQGIPVGTIKKYIAGKGTANKQMVIDAVNARGYRVTDHNEADAMALLLYVESLGE